MALYFVAALLTLPVAYFAPTAMLWAIFGHKLSFPEALRLVAVCAPLLQVLYLLLDDVQQLMPRAALLAIIMAIGSLWVLRVPLMQRLHALGAALAFILIGETFSYLFFAAFFPRFLDPYVRERTLLMNLMPFSTPYMVVAALALVRRLRRPGRDHPLLRTVMMALSPTALLASALAVVLEVERLHQHGPGPYGLQPLLLYALVMMLSAWVTCSILIGIFLRERAKSEALLRYQQTIVSQYDSTRQFRHNYRNTLLMLDGYYRAGDYAALGALLKGMNDEYAAAHSSDYAAGAEAIGDPGVKWLVISKLLHAQSLGVDCGVNVTGSLERCALAPAELAEVLGILLDNATETASQSAGHRMALDIAARGDTLALAVRNTVDAPPDLTRIFDSGYTTKAGHTGLGLYRLRHLLRRYPDALTDARLSDGMFIFTVSI